jgi:mono/diheme cytochrome c family protein
MTHVQTRRSAERVRTAAVRAAVVATLGIGLWAVGGCGDDPRPTATTGREVFTQAGCGSCHRLADAGAAGSFGPNLDRLQPTAADVQRQVRAGGGGMPAYQDQLTAEQIRAVADYVARATRKEPSP